MGNIEQKGKGKKNEKPINVGETLYKFFNLLREIDQETKAKKQ